MRVSIIVKYKITKDYMIYFHNNFVLTKFKLKMATAYLISMCNCMFMLITNYLFIKMNALS